jgi:superfamily I DNA/RNA helicase
MRHFYKGKAFRLTSFAARHIEAACIAANVPYRFIGGMKLLETAHVKDLLSLLRVVANPLDDIAWMRFLTLWNGVGDVGASKLSQQLLAEPEMDIIADRLEKFGKIPLESILIMKQMAVLKTEVEACVSLAIQAIENQLAENYKKDWNRRQGDFELVKQLASKHAQLSEFLEEYVLDPVSISEIERQSDPDVVTLITIHSAKGTEQKVCYVANVTPGQYPHARAQGDFDDVEEQMAAKGQISPEVTVMQQLSKDGFIAELKRAYRLCQYTPEPSVPEPEDETSSKLIIKVTQTPQAWLPDTAILREWHRDLTQLIDGFRNEMVEF